MSSEGHATLGSRFKAQSQASKPVPISLNASTNVDTDFCKQPADSTSFGKSTKGGSDGIRAKKKPKRAAVTLSFGGDDDDDQGEGAAVPTSKKKQRRIAIENTELKDNIPAEDLERDTTNNVTSKPSKFTANSSISIKPRALTKAALQRDTTERQALRDEFLVLQAAVKATEIAIPFVFYDGANTAGGTARMKKGDPIYFFLDKARKMAAEMGVGSDKVAAARRQWARVSVDDLMLVRGSLIIPHHHDFYFFIVNKFLGPNSTRIFDYSAEASIPSNPAAPSPDSTLSAIPLATELLEGAREDATATKVVDRRWYERNKHIYPASMWQDFDPEKDYQAEVKRDIGGNAFFFSK